MKLHLVRDGEILFEMPLYPTDWPAEKLATELEDFADESRTFSKIFDALSNRTCLMMTRLIERRNRAMNFEFHARSRHESEARLGECPENYAKAGCWSRPAGDCTAAQS